MASREWLFDVIITRGSLHDNVQVQHSCVVQAAAGSITSASNLQQGKFLSVFKPDN
jgi:hypothetical protein